MGGLFGALGLLVLLLMLVHSVLRLLCSHEAGNLKTRKKRRNERTKAEKLYATLIRVFDIEGGPSMIPQATLTYEKQRALKADTDAPYT